MHEFDFPVSAKSIDHRVKGIAHDAVTTFYASLLEHFPQ
jgi:hypothetical protein